MTDESKNMKDKKFAEPKNNSEFSLETFRSIGNFEMSSLKLNEPSSFNGVIQVVKYKITVEKISEPKEVYAERLQKLWSESDNHHHWQPLKMAAKEFGIELQGSPGSLRKRREI